MSEVFDAVASQYDKEFTYTAIGKYQRNTVWEYLEKNLAENLNVLELSCGTGEDAIHLAQNGHQVIATDIAEAMVKLTQKKAKTHNLENKIKAVKSSAQEIESLSFDNDFDLVFSNFGGLNCLNSKELSTLSENMNAIMKPNASFIAVMMSDFCLWETAYFLAKRKVNEAFRRRKKEGVMANVGSEKIKTYYYSPANFYKFFQSDFEWVKSVAVGAAIPPSYLEPFFQKRPKYLEILNKIERKINYWKPMAAISDHYLIHLKKK